jgi:hypothetical protein
MRINNTYIFSISPDDVTVLGAHPKSGLPTISIQGQCTSPDGDVYDFVATNNLDLRYADRFKVNWNGNKARMPEVAGHGLTDEVKAGRTITAQRGLLVSPVGLGRPPLWESKWPGARPPARPTPRGPCKLSPGPGPREGWLSLLTPVGNFEKLLVSSMIHDADPRGGPLCCGARHVAITQNLCVSEKGKTPSSKKSPEKFQKLLYMSV